MSEKRQYELAKLYYIDLRAYKKKDINKAVGFLIRATKQDNNIIKYSDIYYLIAKSYYYLDKNDKAHEYFKKFMEYSESITHPNFRYFLNDKDGNKLNELFEDAENHLKENPEDKSHDLALKYHEENYYAKYNKRYYKPGFIMGKDSGIGLIILGLDYIAGYGIGAYCGIYSGLFKFMDAYVGVRYLNKFRQLCISTPLKIYSDNHNRFGVKFVPAFYYNNLGFEQNKQKFEKSYFDFSGNLSVGYYINHYWLIFTGYKYSYYNKSHPYRFTHDNWQWKVWYDNYYYFGNTLFIYKNIGVTLEYSYESILGYLDLYFFNIGYNFTDNKTFVQFYSYSYN